MIFSERDLCADIGGTGGCPDVKVMMAAFAGEDGLPPREEAVALAVRRFRETRGIPDGLSVAAFRDAEDAAECVFYEFFGGKELILPEPARAEFRRLAEKYGAKLISPAPCGKRGTDADCAAVIDMPRLPLLMSQPSECGRELTARQLDDLAETRGGEPFVLDEAFADFAELSAVPFCAKWENMLTIRSMSPAYSMCGFDMAFVVCSAEYAERLERARKTLGIGLPSAREASVAAAELEDTEGFASRQRSVLIWRARFETGFRDMGFDVIGGRMPYGLAAPKAGMDAETFADAVFRATGRRVGALRLPSGRLYLKIPVGAPEETDDILRELGAREMVLERGAEPTDDPEPPDGEYPPMEPPAPRAAWLRASGRVPVTPEEAAELRKSGAERLMIQGEDDEEPFVIEYHDMARDRIYRKQHGEGWDDEAFHIRPE